MIGRRKSTRRGYLRGVAAAGGGSVLAACGPLGGAAREPAAAPPGTKARVRFMVAGVTMQEAWDKLGPTWEQQNPNIEIEWSRVSNVPEKVIAGAAAGDLEDVLDYWMGEQVPQVWFASGIINPVDAQVKANRVNPKDWYKAQWEMMFVDGKQIALPSRGQVHSLGLFYNQNIFDERGMKYPDPSWTLNDLIEAAEKLKVVEGGEVTRWGAAIHDQLWHETFPGYGRNFNAEKFSPDQKRFTWGEGPEFLRLLQWYTDVMQKRVGVVYSKGGDPAGQGTGGYVGLLQGKVAMIFKGYLGSMGQMAAYIRDNPGARYGLTFTPKGPTGRRGGVVASGVTCITSFSKNPDAAFKFAQFVTGREFGVAIGLSKTGASTLHPRPDVYHDPRIIEDDPYTPKDANEFRMKSLDFTEREEDCGYTRAVPWNFRASEIFQVERQTTHKIFTGEAPGNQDLLNELRRLVEPIMQQPRPRLATS